MKKSLVATVACAVAVSLGMTSCKKEGIHIGVIQHVEHDALNASYKGFVDALKDAGYEDGKNIHIDYENAQNDQSNNVTIADKFANDNVDLILAIATPSAAAAAARTEEIPILVTAVTDPADAKIVESNEKPGRNVSGTSDLTPVKQQMQLLKKLIPGAKKVGMLYCSGESNSFFQVGLAKNECDALGLSYVDATVSNSNEIQQVVEDLCHKVDAIYAPTDNMIASAMKNVSQVATENKIPVIVGEKGMVDNGGLATYGINYYDLGVLTGKMAVRILKGESKPADMPIEYLEKFDLSINYETAEKLGIEIPEELK